MRALVEWTLWWCCRITRLFLKVFLARLGLLCLGALAFGVFYSSGSWRSGFWGFLLEWVLAPWPSVFDWVVGCSGVSFSLLAGLPEVRKHLVEVAGKKPPGSPLHRMYRRLLLVLVCRYRRLGSFWTRGGISQSLLLKLKNEALLALRHPTNTVRKIFLDCVYLGKLS